MKQYACVGDQFVVEVEIFDAYLSGWIVCLYWATDASTESRENRRKSLVIVHVPNALFLNRAIV